MHTNVEECPECGWPLLTGYRATGGNYEPAALCTRPSCTYAY